MSELSPGHPYRHLLSPGRLGPLVLRNRILMSPMGDNLAGTDGHPSSASMDYFEARAKGGAALLLIGSVAVTWPEGSYNPNQSSLSADRYIPSFAELARRVHAQGAKLAAQLSHGGITAVNDIRDGRPLQVPSLPKPGAPDPLMAMVTPEERALQSRPMRAPTAKVALHEMTIAEIAGIVRAYADAAVRAQRAGLDGVELHAGHGYLISSFLSPAKNHRVDAYGGSLEKRARLLVEVIRAVRERVGRDFAVWCRIDSIEFWEEGGVTPELAAEVSRFAEAAGCDAIHASANGLGGRALTYTEGHTVHRPAGLLAFAASIRKAVGIPVIAVGRIEPEVAESAIAEGKADFVAMGRKLLADLELPNKLIAARPEDVRPCLYHYNCIGQIFLREPVRCWVNPATGREHEFELEPAASRRRVLVIGGGPAGLEAARIAALRGHEVVICESGDRLGGRFALAARTYEPNARMLAWLEGQLRKAKVELQLRTRVDLRSAQALAPDAVVLATGARWERPALPGADASHVFCVDALRGFLDDGAELPGPQVAILGGGRAGVGLAGICAERGYRVSVLEASAVFAQQMGLPGRWRIVHELREQGVELQGEACITGIRPGAVDWVDAQGAARETPADSVLIASGATPASELAAELRAAGLETHAIGDCEEVGFVRGALESAARAAARI